MGPNKKLTVLSSGQNRIEWTVIKNLSEGRSVDWMDYSVTALERAAQSWSTMSYETSI